MRTLLFGTVLSCAVFLGCEPEIGSPCDPDKELVDKLVKQTAGTNNLVSSPKFECSQAFCLSTDGSRPYCTVRCESDADCAEAGEKFHCKKVIDFGENACSDYTPETDCLTGPDETFSEHPFKYCAADSPAVIAERDVEFGRE